MVQKPLVFLSFLTFLFSLSGCFLAPRYEIEKVPQKYEVEVETIDQVALEAVESAKTDFFVPIYEDSATWDRTKIFFVKYLNIPNLKNLISRAGNTTVISSAKSPEDHEYHYEVRRELFGNGYNYFVKCKPLKGSATYKSAALNAKNLARFIQDGVLEITLLK